LFSLHPPLATTYQGARPVDDVTRLLSDLVAIPSVNPMGRALTGEDVLETRLTDYLETWFRGLGVACRRQPVAPGRDNILALYQAPAPGRTILFDVHQDTVPTDGMTIPPFEPATVGGRLYGRGSCDVKGSMAAMLAAFARLVRERPAGSASVLLACTVDEEFTHTGSSRLSETDHGAELAIVAEPTLLNLVDCHKGALRWKIRTRGLACHSSTPHLGVNAIYRMGRVLEALESFAGSLSRFAPDPRLGPPSLSVGRIEGGQSVNVVPDWCEIEVDRRILPGEEPARCLEQVTRLLSDRLGELDGVEFGQPWVNLPPLSPRAAQWLEPLGDAIAAATGRRPEVMGVPFGTDAGPLNARGTPCIVFGPGNIAQAHTKDEWIELEQVRLAAQAYYQIAVALGRAEIR
jgi:acetylornithine deacetylase/succinyl-diaminopimelate desuccinylase-like protein